MTNFAAIDCEMDYQIPKDSEFYEDQIKFNVKNPGLVCKISVVNQFGEIVLDTLIDYDDKPVIKHYEKKTVKFEMNGHQSVPGHQPVGTASTDSTSKNISSGSDDEVKAGQKRTHSQRFRQPKLKEKKNDFVIDIQLSKKNVHSMQSVHGIQSRSITGAPSFFEVRAHLEELIRNCELQTKEKVILIGHSVVSDIETMILEKVKYIDTTNFKFKSDQVGETKKLSELVKVHLNAKIQDGTHSSLIDARSAMALFNEFRFHKEMFYGPSAIKSYNRALVLQDWDKRENNKAKKRVKKVHRKELIERVKNSELKKENSELQKLDKVQKWCRKTLNGSYAACKLVVLGIGVYTIQMFANSQFNG